MSDNGNWTQNGIDYICQKYGDSNYCVVSTGLSWYAIDIHGDPHDQTGGTADIIALLAFNMINEIQMTYPDRPNIIDPSNKLVQANGHTISGTDAQIVTQHDENSGDQWCYSAPQNCTNPTGTDGQIICGNPNYGQDPTHKYRCTGGVWVDQGYNATCEVQTGCTNPTGLEGSEACIDGYMKTCTSRSWVKNTPDELCIPCEQIVEKENCVLPCHWYKQYLWEKESCHTEEKNQMLEYAVYAGIGMTALGIAILIMKRR